MPHFSMVAKAVIDIDLKGITADDQAEAISRGTEMIEDVIKYGTVRLDEIKIEIREVKEE